MLVVVQALFAWGVFVLLLYLDLGDAIEWFVD